MKSSNETSGLPTLTGAFQTIFLEIRGIGNVPSMKNNKSLFRSRKTGKLFIATNPKKKEWMEKAIQLLESQFAGLFPITASETHGEWRKRLLTAWYLPGDDSLDWMIPGAQQVVRVPHGSEGCTIIIERIS